MGLCAPPQRSPRQQEQGLGLGMVDISAPPLRRGRGWPAGGDMPALPFQSRTASKECKGALGRRVWMQGHLPPLFSPGVAKEAELAGKGHEWGAQTQPKRQDPPLAGVQVSLSSGQAFICCWCCCCPRGKPAGYSPTQQPWWKGWPLLGWQEQWCLLLWPPLLVLSPGWGLAPEVVPQ